jgi:hypothetical protein
VGDTAAGELALVLVLGWRQAQEVLAEAVVMATGIKLGEQEIRVILLLQKGMLVGTLLQAAVAGEVVLVVPEPLRILTPLQAEMAALRSRVQSQDQMFITPAEEAVVLIWAYLLV